MHNHLPDSDTQTPPDWLTIGQVADMLAISTKSLYDQITRQPENPRPVSSWFIAPAIKDGKKSMFTDEQAQEMVRRKTAKKSAPALNLGLAFDDGNATKENAPTTNEGADKNTFDVSDYIPVSHAGGDFPAFALFDGIESKTANRQITYPDLVAMAESPIKVNKKSAPCFVPANVTQKTGIALAEATGYALIVADVDHHMPQIEIMALLERYGIAKALIYSTASATAEMQKNRVVMPLRAPCAYETWVMLTQWLCWALGGDRTAERKTQVSFVPNRGEFYEKNTLNQGHALDPKDSSHPAIIDALAFAEKLATDQEQQAKRASVPPSLANEDSVIAAFNDMASIDQILKKNGYKRLGKKWLCPNSTSGIAGVSIISDRETRRERVFSHHSMASDPLANGHAHDAFSAFAVLEHGGDVRAATIAAGEQTGITKANRDAYKEQRHREHLARERKEREQTTTTQTDPVSQAGGSDECQELRLEQFLLDLNIPPESNDCGWTLKNWLPFGEVTLLAGHGGSGKSYVALVLAVHVALGLHFGDVETTQGRVLFVSCEDSGRTVKQRLAKIAQGVGMGVASIGQNLDVLDLSDHDAILYSEMQTDRAMMPTPTARDLVRLVRARDYALVVVDNASETFGGNEINRQQVRGFIRMLRQGLANENSSVLLLAHINKMSAKDSSDNEDYSGSTAWHNSVRSRISLASGQQDGQLLLKHQKSNYGRLQKEPIVLMWGEGEYPHPVDGISVAKFAETDRQKKHEWLIESMRQIERSGGYLTTTFRSTGNCLQQLADYTGKGRPFFGKPKSSDIKPIIHELEELGLIEIASIPAGNGKTREVWRITR